MTDPSQTKRNVEPPLIQLADILSADPEAPISSERSVDCSVLWRHYSTARDAAELGGDGEKAAVYILLGGVCSMGLQAGEPLKPFTPLMAWAAGSTPTPLTYRGKQSMVFGELAAQVGHPALKARLADLAWVNAKQHDAARLAIDGYIECVSRILAGKAEMRSRRNEASGPRALDLLRRACVLQRQIGWGGGRTDDLVSLAKTVRQRASKREDVFGFVRASDLELDFKTTRAASLAKAAEALAVSRAAAGDADGPEQLWRLTARAYARADRKNDADRALVQVAERLVETADRMTKSPMHETHWLEQAIATLRRVRGTNARRADLQARLVRKQGDIADFMAPISSSADISEIIEGTKAQLGGKELADALLIYAVQSRSPAVADLRREAEEAIGRSPFGSLFASVIYDETFKPASRTPPAGGFASPPNEANIRVQIIQHEQIRRGLIVAGQIEPGRYQIVFDHGPDERVLTMLAAMSPFVPPHHEAFFGRGFFHFFNGDFIEAAHLLVPQLENSLRYVLNAADVDTTRLKSDLTQSSATLSTLLDPSGEWRKPLEELIGDAVVFEIENMFDHQAGPTLRHRMAHGLLHQWVFGGRDAIYACWFIYRLCIEQLAPHADEVRRRLRSLT